MMLSCLILGLLLSLCLPRDTDGLTRKRGIMVSPGLLLYHDYITWEEAFAACQDMAANLATPMSFDEFSVVQKMLGSKEHLWFGEYTYYTPWMYSTGCYSSKSSQYTKIEYNDVGGCKTTCGDSDIMLSRDKCLCVEQSPDIASQENLSECEHVNGTNSTGNAYLHYSTYRKTKQETPGNNCGMYERLKHTSDGRILARNCKAPIPSLCMSYDGSANETSLYPPKDDNGRVVYLSYQEAVDTCAGQGSILADPTKLHSIELGPHDPVRYWVGVRRKAVYVRSTEGHNLPSKNTSPMCLYMTRLSSFVFENRRKNCYSPSSFLCRKMESTVTSPSHGSVNPVLVTGASIAVLTVLSMAVVIRGHRNKFRRLCCVDKADIALADGVLEFYNGNLDEHTMEHDLS